MSIREGYNAEVDRLRGILTGGRDMVAALEAQEKEKTGIQRLKVGDLDGVGQIHLGHTVAIFHRHPGEGAEHIHLGHGAQGGLQQGLWLLH